jgi:valyl-tRNA synthetase
MAGSRNFATKLWNAARFTLAQLEGKSAPEDLAGCRLSLPDRWILSRLDATAGAVNGHLEEFRFDEAAGAIYGFLWHELCDGYLEMVKPVLSGADAAASESARGVLRRCLEGALALLHPFMPFLTEEIWEKLTGRAGTLVVAPYPIRTGTWADGEAEVVIEALRAIVTRVRNFRAERGASPTEPVALSIDPASPGKAALPALETLAPLLTHLGRLSELVIAAAPAGRFQDVVAGLGLGLALPEGSAPDAGARVEKDLAATEMEIAGLAAKLQNPSYVEKAPAAVVEKTRLRLRELEEKRAALTVSRS